tara:strand:- start:268 stop:468 length:201 start_codon:yes stop_codon:yes gene_type:complete
MAVVELITTDVHALEDLVFGEVQQELDTHKVVTLVIIIKIIAHRAVAEQVDIFMDTEVQMDVRVTA